MVNMLLIYAENKTALPEHMKSFVTLNHCKGSALLKVPFILVVDVQIHTRLSTD